MAEKREIEINVKTDKAVNNVDKLTDAVEDTAKAADKAEGSFDGLVSGIDKMTGGLVSGFKNAVTGIKNGVKAMKTLKVAIAATGIGALVLVLGSVVTFFSKTQRGADLLSKATKALGAVVDVLVDRFSAFGERVAGVFKDPQQALKDFGELIKQNIQNRITGMLELLPALGKAISLAFKGQFKEAAETAADAAGKVVLGVEDITDKASGAAESVKGLVKEITEEASAAIALEKANQKLQDREIAMIETRAERRASIEALRLVAADETRDLQARANALKEAMDLEKQLADEEVAIAAERARILQEQNALGESTREDLQAEAEANARVIELQAQRDTRLKELVATYNSLNKQVRDAAQAIRDEESAILELNTKAVDSKKFAVDNELKMHKMLRTSMAQIDQQYASVKEQIEADSAKKTRDQKMAELDIVAGALNGLGQLAGENAAAGKAISAAEAVINTYTGATKALAQGGIFGAIAAAGVVASGLASVRAIYQTDVPTPSPSNVSVGGRQLGGGSRGSVPSAPTPNIPRPQGLNASIGFDTTGANLGNQIAESLQGSSMRAYVVNQDIQSAQKLDRKIEETATFG